MAPEDALIEKARYELAFDIWRRRWHKGVPKSALNAADPHVILRDFICMPLFYLNLSIEVWHEWLAA